MMMTILFLIRRMRVMTMAALPTITKVCPTAITPKWFWELRYTDAGEAELGNVNPALDEAISDAAISYKIPSIMAGYVVWSGAVDVYVKAGMSFIETKSTDSRIGQDEQSSTQLAMGAVCSTACWNCPGRCICH